MHAGFSFFPFSLSAGFWGVGYDTGELRHIQKLRYWPLDAVLHDKYLLPKEEADMIASFLTPMLRLHPDKRAKASELIHHAWLDGIVVQGEIDVIRRAEEEERRRKVGAGGAGAVAAGGSSAASGSGGIGGSQSQVLDEDAMKPVEDVITVSADESSGAPPPSAVPKIATPVPSSSSTAKENAAPAAGGHARTPGSGSGSGNVPTLQPLPPNGRANAPRP